MKTIGDHIRKVRIDQGLLQRDVAELIGVSEATIWNWESALVAEPEIRHGPGIIRFLGYIPISWEDALPSQLWAFRWINGLSQERAAKRLGVDETTWRKWEAKLSTPTIDSVNRIRALIKPVLLVA